MAVQFGPGAPIKKRRNGPPRTHPRCIKCDKWHDMSGNLCQIHDTERRFNLGLMHNRPTILKQLVRIQGRICACCKLHKWMGSNIPLEVDHIDGNAGNNMPENLRLLCPNCHAQTPTAKGKNKGKGRKTLGLPRH